MEKEDLTGKKLYRLSYRSYEGEIKGGEDGVNGELSYVGIIKSIEDKSITFSDNKCRVLIDNLNKGYLFLDLEDILSQGK